MFIIITMVDYISKTRHSIVGKTDNEVTYTLYQVEKIKEEWLEEPILNAIKEENNSSHFIVFEKPSDNVEFDETTNEVVMLKDYVLLYNEKLLKDTRQLQSIVSRSVDNYICFSTGKDFHEIFATCL